MDFENQQEEGKGYPLPPRSSFHRTKNEKTAAPFILSRPVIIGSILIVVILAMVLFNQVFGDKGAEGVVEKDQQNQATPNTQQPNNSENSDPPQEEQIALETSGETTEEETADQTVNGNLGAELQEIIHVVESGENLYRISLKYYQSGKYAKALAEYNGLTDKDALYAGYKLKIPDKDVLQP